MNPLEIDLAGIRLRNPLILASGILGSTAGALLRAARAGAGAVTTKTITPEPRAGNPNPVVVELGFGLLNSMGLPNPGVEAFVDELRRYRSSSDTPVIASVWGETQEETAYVAARLERAGADAIEVNISCPNVDGAARAVEDLSYLRSLISAVKEETSVQLFVKLPPLNWGVVNLAKEAVNAGADALVATNTLRAMIIDFEARSPVLSNVFGGLSGPALKPVAVRVVYELYEEFQGEVPIVGVGGVQDWRDAVEFLLAGASAVEIGTAIASKGIVIFREVTEGVRSYLNRVGLDSVSQLVRGAHWRASRPTQSSISRGSPNE